jgi:hypothetical protein
MREGGADKRTQLEEDMHHAVVVRVGDSNTGLGTPTGIANAMVALRVLVPCLTRFGQNDAKVV